jgi:arylsulfatase A-like enzyme
VLNFVRTRHDEIGIGDAFARAGYRTAWAGKWHLHTGAFPNNDVKDWVPEGRDRLGFQFWRAYNFHMTYFQGWVHAKDWRCEQWEGYETEALSRHAFQFMDGAGDEPFILFLSPHQPHGTSPAFAPRACYDRLPAVLELPENVPAELCATSLEMYRHYLAMIIALDDMVGEVLTYLDRTGRTGNTIVVFASDHGTQAGAHGIDPWQKMAPYEESIRIPLIMRWPGVLQGGLSRDTLVAPVDLFPSLCSLCGVPVPRTVEGFDLSAAWRSAPGAFEQDAVLTMGFSAAFDWLVSGNEWRGVRTKAHSYARWLDGRAELYDLERDPLQMSNLAGQAEHVRLERELEQRLRELMAARHDNLVPCTSYASWSDSYRRVIRNVHGELGHPEDPPDWSLLS